jgi:hypothetical protein
VSCDGPGEENFLYQPGLDGTVMQRLSIPTCNACDGMALWQSSIWCTDLCDDVLLKISTLDGSTERGPIAHDSDPGLDFVDGEMWGCPIEHVELGYWPTDEIARTEPICFSW